MYITKMCNIFQKSYFVHHLWTISKYASNLMNSDGDGGVGGERYFGETSRKLHNKIRKFVLRINFLCECTLIFHSSPTACHVFGDILYYVFCVTKLKNRLFSRMFSDEMSMQIIWNTPSCLKIMCFLNGTHKRNYGACILYIFLVYQFSS